MEWSHTRRLQNIFLNIFPKIQDYDDADKERNRRMRHLYDSALNANSALQNLLRREATAADALKMMGSAAFRTITEGRRTFTRSDAEWVYYNGQGETYSLNDISLSEDIFLRDEVSSEETFKVGGIILRPQEREGPVTRVTRIKVGLYEINSTMEQWAEGLTDRLREARDKVGRPLKPYEVEPIFDLDPEWVNDDTSLVGRCIREHRTASGRVYAVLLVSSDRRLANQMAQQANLSVYRIASRDYISACLRRGRSPQEGLSLTEVLGIIRPQKPKPDKLYVDTGSLAAYAVRLEDAGGGKYLQRKLLETGYEPDSMRRYSRVALHEIPLLEQVEVHRHLPVTRPRVYRSGSRPAESVYSSHASWRRSTTGPSTGSGGFPPQAFPRLP